MDEIVTLSYEPRLVMPASLQLTSAESLELFVRGVNTLNNYGKSLDPSRLRTAIQTLQECVNSYPNDTLPLFYLGVAKSMTSYEGADDAIDHFRVIETSEIPSLRLVAKYNRAVTLITKYEPQFFVEAASLLDEVIQEVNQLQEDQPARRTRQGIPNLQPIILQAKAKRLFIEIRQSLWYRRYELEPTVDEQVATGLRTKLRDFEIEVRNAGTNAGSESIRQDLWTYHWNNLGLLEESLAFLFRKSDNDAKKIQHATESIKCYRMSLECRPNWPNALANLARVNCDLLENAAEAIPIFERLASGVQQNQYAHYMLGRIYRDQGDLGRAREHFLQAPSIPKAAEFLAQIVEENNLNETEPPS